jgi:membrane protein YqaA with SNARE-associated domain
MIVRTLHTLRDRLTTWTAQKSRSKHALTWLSIVSFTESSFFPIPPDILLAPIVVAGERGKWKWYALLTTVTSMLGGLFGYLIGAVFYNTLGVKIIELYNLGDAFARIGEVFQSHAFFAMFAVSFTPIPYKVFTIAAGLFSVNVWIFILASFLGRGLRFFAVAFVMHRYGARISDMMYRYFNLLTLLIVAIILLLIIFLQ